MFDGNTILFYFLLVLKHKEMISVKVDPLFNYKNSSKFTTHTSDLSNAMGKSMHVQRM